MSNSGTATPSDLDTAQRHRGTRPMHHDQNHSMASPASNVSPKRSGASTSSGSSDPEADVRPRNVKAQPQYYQQTWHNEEQRGRATPQADSGRTSRMFGHRRNFSNNSTEETSAPVAERQPTRVEHGQLSPPLTGKDSAYSSVYGASPTAVPSRSASAMSSHPQAQFGLFPSSARTTPKGSMSGRYGAMSPVLSPPLRSAKSSAPPSRPDTAVSNFSDASASSKRLSKRSSFTSLRRLFTKKRTADNIDSIAE